MKDNVIQFPDQDRTLTCINTVIEGIRKSCYEDEDCFYQIHLLNELLGFYEEYEESLEIFAIKNHILQAILMISHYYES